MTDRLLVCGLGSGMDRSLTELRSPRWELVVATDRPTDRARAAADVLLAVDPNDAVAVLAELSAAGIDRIDGVFSLGADNPPVISTLARRFGCPGLPLETALDCTLKDRRLRILRAAGLDLPRFATAESVGEAVRAAADIGLPVVLKPSDQTGSLGVLKAESAGQVRALAQEALRLSPGGRIVVEEFLEGTEHTLAAFMVDGALHRFGFADREYGNKERFAPHFFEGGDTLPSRLTDEQIEEVTETVRRGATALRLDPAVVNTDILRTRDGRVVLLEITCRLTGARIATEVMRLATGVDPLPNVVRLALGRPLDLAELRPRHSRAAVQRFLPADGGVVEWAGDPRDVARRAGVHDVFWGLDLRPGTVVPPYRGGAEVLAGVIAHAERPQEAEAIAERTLNSLPLRFKAGTQ
ncbi:biotin carboxylase [Streptomyces sp. 3211.6]|uniref:ATP-grasp domain-containing protein n=1 Tax=Streptomyces TaxID=1883 RepID=UPI0009A54488|nr:MULTISPECIES: ATP-grasp domain-containing protein [Streptomyces]RKT02894.1 biotin carboxylase [Streptomyces sp. 3211.6]RPF44220.1 biotin carboxylase [Streptomyces sp. Ag109_G2-6]